MTKHTQQAIAKRMAELDEGKRLLDALKGMDLNAEQLERWSRLYTDYAVDMAKLKALTGEKQ